MDRGKRSLDKLETNVANRTWPVQKTIWWRFALPFGHKRGYRFVFDLDLHYFLAKKGLSVCLWPVSIMHNYPKNLDKLDGKTMEKRWTNSTEKRWTWKNDGQKENLIKQQGSSMGTWGGRCQLSQRASRSKPHTHTSPETQQNHVDHPRTPRRRPRVGPQHPAHCGHVSGKAEGCFL